MPSPFKKHVENNKQQNEQHLTHNPYTLTPTASINTLNPKPSTLQSSPTLSHLYILNPEP